MTIMNTNRSSILYYSRSSITYFMLLLRGTKRYWMDLMLHEAQFEIIFVEIVAFKHLDRCVNKNKLTDPWIWVLIIITLKRNVVGSKVKLYVFGILKTREIFCHDFHRHLSKFEIWPLCWSWINPTQFLPHLRLLHQGFLCSLKPVQDTENWYITCFHQYKPTAYLKPFNWKYNDFKFKLDWFAVEYKRFPLVVA